MINNTAVSTDSGSTNNIQPEFPDILSQAVYLKGYQIADFKKAGVIPLLPISRTSWLKGVKDGIYPQPVKFGRSTLWKSSDIKNLLIELEE